MKRAILAQKLGLACAIGGVVLALAVFVRDHYGSLYDDAYIYLRYVKNVRAGCGLRFNCDDPRVEGFSGPIYLALLWAGSLFTQKLVLLTHVIGTLALGATIVVAMLTPRLVKHQRPLVDLAVCASIGCALASDHYVLLNATSGMETGVAALAVGLILAGSLSQWRWPLVALVLVSTLARPEAFVFVFALPVARWVRDRFAVSGLVLGIAAITVVRWLVFHDVLPNTYYAKSGGTTAHLHLGLSYVGSVIADFPMILFAPLALLDQRLRPKVTWFLVAALLWFAFFLRSGGDPFLYGRLAFPLVAALTVLAVMGLSAAARRFESNALASLFVLVPSLAVGGRAAVAHAIAPQHGFQNVAAWATVGRYLKANYPGKTVATVPIGAIGYYSGLKVIDLVGLTTPAIAKANRSVPADLLTRTWLAHERHNLEWVLAQQPDLVVTTKYRATPWIALEDAQTGFYADWLLLRAAKQGLCAYDVRDARIADGVHWLMLSKRGLPGPSASDRGPDRAE
jgi:arabinofuranosyltransferase